MNNKKAVKTQTKGDAKMSDVLTVKDEDIEFESYPLGVKGKLRRKEIYEDR